MTRELPADVEHALSSARAAWASSYGTGSRFELCRKYERTLQLAVSLHKEPFVFDELRARIERQHRLKYGEVNLSAELVDERERDLATTDDGALVAYEKKWARRLAKLQRVHPSRWRVPGLSDDELRDELTLRLIEAVRTRPEELVQHHRAGKEWGLLFLAQQRRVLRQDFNMELVFDDEPPALDRPPTGEEQLIDAQSANLQALALERAESSLTLPQRRWFAAMKVSASAGEFFESSGKLNLSAVSRLLDKDRSSAQRAFGELQRRFARELKKLGG